MKAFFLLPLLFGACVWADEAADRAAIGLAIGALNEFPQRAELFTADADGRSVLGQLWKGKRLVYQMRLRAGDPVPWSSSDLHVIISHEPWGEATINFPGMGSMTYVAILNPQIESGAIRFITRDVALADGACTYKDDSTATQTTPLLFVMKREGDDWKIASLRLLVPR